MNAENKIVGIGYNGMPNGCSDDLLPWRRTAESRLDTKYPYGRAWAVFPSAFVAWPCWCLSMLSFKSSTAGQKKNPFLWGMSEDVHGGSTGCFLATQKQSS